MPIASKYKPEYGEVLVDMMSKGLSQAAVARHLGVSSATINAWAKVHPEFEECLIQGQDASKTFYEQKLMALIEEGANLRSAAPVKALEFLMASRFRSDYAKSSTTHQEVTVTHVAKLTDNQLDDRINKLLGQIPKGNIIEGELVNDTDSQ